MNEIVFCKCGCGASFEKLRKCKGYPKGYARQYLVGHAMKGRKRPDQFKPESINGRTGRTRAEVLINAKEKECELAFIGGCSTKHEIHHFDRNPMNNEFHNLMVLCGSHHRLLEKGHINLRNPIMPPFIISSNKRRYKYDGHSWEVKE